MKVTLMRLLAVLLLTIALSGCHVASHYPPGQMKKVIKPVPPGHGGIPPGKYKKKKY